MAQFMKEIDLALARMGAELTLQSQVIDKQREQIVELTTELNNLKKAERREKGNGHLSNGHSELEAGRRSESEVISG